MFAGTSASVAVAVNDSVVSSLTVLLPGLATVGAVFTSVTVIVIAVVPPKAGLPLSVPRIVTG